MSGVRLDVPRDRDGSFEPRIAAKQQKLLTGVDEMLISPVVVQRLGASAEVLARLSSADVSKAGSTSCWNMAAACSRCVSASLSCPRRKQVTPV
jgi:hypothetical protein